MKKKEKILEINVDGISNMSEMDRAMKEISKDAENKIIDILDNIIKKKKYTNKELKKLISFSKWANE